MPAGNKSSRRILYAFRYETFPVVVRLFIACVADLDASRFYAAVEPQTQQA